MRRLIPVLTLLLALLLPAQSWAGIAVTVTSSNTTGAGALGATTYAMTAVNASSGALLVVCVKHNNGTAAPLVSIAGTGGDTFTMLTNQSHSTNNPHARCGYRLIATANAAYVATLTFTDTTPTYIRAVIYVITYTGTMAFDAEIGSTEAVTSTSPSSNSITTAAYDASNDGICVGLHADNTTQTLSAEKINTVAATATFIGNDTSVFYRILTAGFTGVSNITRTAQPANWVQRVSCFKTDAGGGAPATNFFRARIQP